MTDQPATDEVVLVLQKQREQIRWPHKWAASRGGQGAGKTTGWSYWVWDRLEEAPRQIAVVVGASYTQVRDGFFGTFQNMLWKHGLEEGRDYVYRRTPSPRIRFKHNGAVLHSWSADLVARIRSVNVQTLVLEEPQTWGPQAENAWISVNGRLRPNMLTAALYPGLEPQGRMSFNPTDVGPGHWLYELIEERWPQEGIDEATGEFKYRCWKMSTRENEILLSDDPGYVRNLEISMSPSRWGVEIDGEWATTPGGAVYREFDAAIHGKPLDALPMALDPSRPLLWALDFNIANMASVIAQLWEQKDRIDRWEPAYPGQPPEPVLVHMIPGWQKYIFQIHDEIALVDTPLRGALEAFLTRYGDWLRANDVPVILYGDSTGGNRNQQTIWSNWEVIMHGLTNAGIGWESRIPANGPEWDRVNAMNAQFRTGDGYGVQVDLAHCKQLVLDWLNVKAVDGKNEINKKDYPKRTHWSDACGYMVLTEQKIARRENPKFLNFIDR